MRWLRVTQFQRLLKVVRERGGNGTLRGRPWSLPLTERVLVVAVYYRTNLTMRQLGPLFGVSSSAVCRIIQRLGPLLALEPVDRPDDDPDRLWIVDGTLVPVRDRSVGASSRSYRFSANVQVIVDTDTRLVVAAAGAPTQKIYARWCRHMCGITCLRMVLLHRDGHAPSMFELLNGACRYGAYVKQDDGTIKGLIYAPFVEYVADTHRLPGEVHGELDLDGLVDLLGAGRMVMVSVSKEIRRPDIAPERRGGHLVLAIGRRDGQIILRNPSGHTPEALAPTMPLDRFGAFFGGRCLSLDPRSTVRRRTALTAASRPGASQPST
ncbi:transposase family protein [Streptomyces capitiformicae]|uniref:DDE superfamily endonuclease n=1 Tax=Streptomyces capitiformicae TaxID=2014920 RepID=A0A919DMM1_9ACTN|nr:hypothetical protein GCM10017771_79950 [Streptomyces capitiformicae]